MHIRIFREKALDCYDQVDDEMLINVCLHGMTKEYRVFLENLSFLSSKMMEAAQPTKESVDGSSKFHANAKPSQASTGRPAQKKSDICGL